MKTTVAVVFWLFLCHSCISAAQDGRDTWTFAVSGDSRNCGDVIMPAIAEDALKKQVEFYWHLGDFRAIYQIDEDFQQTAGSRVGKLDYLNQAWPDFIQNQLLPFGDTPVFLVRGNHELIPPKDTEEYLAQFSDWLNTPVIQQQRLKDDPVDHLVKTYYHWTHRGVDFIAIDNSAADQLDPEQMKWIEGVLDRDRKDDAIHTIVVGMHEALPDSIAASHGMNESPVGLQSGRRLYQMLLKMQNDAHKIVYVLASHAHYFMDGIFNTPYWKSNGGVIPGWIIGTAGSVRYPLPVAVSDATAAKTNVYGYMLATVNAHEADRIKFEFREIEESAIPETTRKKYTAAFVHLCMTENRRLLFGAESSAPQKVSK